MLEHCLPTIVCRAELVLSQSLIRMKKRKNSEKQTIVGKQCSNIQQGGNIEENEIDADTNVTTLKKKEHTSARVPTETPKNHHLAIDNSKHVSVFEGTIQEQFRVEKPDVEDYEIKIVNGITEENQLASTKTSDETKVTLIDQTKQKGPSLNRFRSEQVPSSRRNKRVARMRDHSYTDDRQRRQTSGDDRQRGQSYEDDGTRGQSYEDDRRRSQSYEDDRRKGQSYEEDQSPHGSDPERTRTRDDSIGSHGDTSDSTDQTPSKKETTNVSKKKRRLKKEEIR
jgi:hypothetical protein